ncbi:MAG TPA: hypothetical protein PK777_00900 [Thermoguttaceae bacterium]|nr:hypothetical protein [Thermoguttaceae bacterium]HPP51478.1 hypothetical protein [Thermoguttaceae bacterium]
MIMPSLIIPAKPSFSGILSSGVYTSINPGLNNVRMPRRETSICDGAKMR